MGKTRTARKTRKVPVSLRRTTRKTRKTRTRKTRKTRTRRTRQKVSVSLRRKTRRTTRRSKPRLKKKIKSYGPLVACACACACARARARVCACLRTKVHCCFCSLVLRPGMFYRNQHTLLFFFFGLQAGDFLSQAPHMLQARAGRYDQRPTEN